MARIIVQVAMNRIDGVPADVVTNVMHFESDHLYGASSGADEIEVATRVTNFYQAWETYSSTVLDGTGLIKIYDWDEPKPRVPKDEFGLVFTPGSGGMPSEVASCLSFAAEAVSGMSMARRRGRIFLGPLGSNAAEYVAGTLADFTPAAAFRTAVIGAADNLAVPTISGGYRLAVYSPRTKELGGSDDTAWNDVKMLWMDNAFDTIRSRGFKATTRTSVTL